MKLSQNCFYYEAFLYRTNDCDTDGGVIVDNRNEIPTGQIVISFTYKISQGERYTPNAKEILNVGDIVFHGTKERWIDVVSIEG